MNILHKFKRPSYLLASGVMALSAIAPVLINATANAYGLVGSRSIELSSSAQAATDVNYLVSFTTASTSNLGGIVIDFCDNSPIIGDSCTTGANSLNINKATLAISAVTAALTTAGFAKDTTNSTATKLVYTTATPITSLAASTALTFTLGGAGASDGVTNPNTSNTTFYGRILTYTTAAGATGYVPGTPGAVVDAGGIALSTANQITVTSKVQERLTFCVYTAGTCAGGGSAVSLGDTNGVLDPAGPYVDKNTKYDVATNASQGASIRLKGDTLKAGAFSINAAGASAVASSAGTEQFGFCTYTTAGTNLTPAAPYNNAGCSGTTQSAGTATPGGATGASFALDTANTNTTYGQIFANATAGPSSSGDIAFLGNVSNTTEAAIYQTTLTFIATGIY